MNKKSTILLADDHSILRAGLRSILDNHPDFKIIAEADNGKDALQKSIALKPDLLLTDLSMPKTNGTECIRELKKRAPEVKVLVLTMHAGEEHIHAAINAGADGYVLKDDSHDELIKAIKNILNGKTHLSPSICNNAINDYLNVSKTNKPTASWEILTHREREVIKLIAEGYRSKDIAEYLTISIKTVEKHRSNLMKKLDLHSVSSLTNYATQHGLANQD
ncbi:MAG: response regulator transcription factor [Gammaproteobacteria bacterium]|nr:response regulator transcription factor [Gammaproteobacteria bacterium]